MDQHSHVKAAHKFVTHSLSRQKKNKHIKNRIKLFFRVSSDNVKKKSIEILLTILNSHRKCDVFCCSLNMKEPRPGVATSCQIPDELTQEHDFKSDKMV